MNFAERCLALALETNGHVPSRRISIAKIAGGYAEASRLSEETVEKIVGLTYLQELEKSEKLLEEEFGDDLLWDSYAELNAIDEEEITTVEAATVRIANLTHKIAASRREMVKERSIKQALQKKFKIHPHEEK